MGSVTSNVQVFFLYVCIETPQTHVRRQHVPSPRGHHISPHRQQPQQHIPSPRIHPQHIPSRHRSNVSMPPAQQHQMRDMLDEHRRSRPVETPAKSPELEQDSVTTQNLMDSLRPSNIF